MTDNSNNTTESNSSAETETTEHMIPKSRFDDVNRKYRDTLSRLEALEKAQTERDESTRKQRETELAEQNQYKQLYESAKAEVESVKALQGEVKRYRESFESTLQSRLTSIPDDKKHLVPEFDDPIKLNSWLDKALPDLVAPGKPAAPKIDGGSGSLTRGNLGTARLTPEEVAMAQAFGLSEQEYADMKAKRGQPINLRLDPNKKD